MAVHVTADTHRWKDLAKLGEVEWPEGQGLSREDYLVILGDCGGVWTNPEDGSLVADDDRELLAWFERQP